MIIGTYGIASSQDQLKGLMSQPMKSLFGPSSWGKGCGKIMKKIWEKMIIKKYQKPLSQPQFFRPLTPSNKCQTHGDPWEVQASVITS